ncbi:hypothetical protein J6590_021723 [Homalodisca vitripennis]|nr:hypothetical protein J6590_021723 [Homalodisca vitripennis]
MKGSSGPREQCEPMTKSLEGSRPMANRPVISGGSSVASRAAFSSADTVDTMRPEMNPGASRLQGVRAADSMSEVSEGTTGTSVSTRGSTYSEDLQDLARHLGLSGPDQLAQDRFRVDRRKLEVMLRGTRLHN